MYRILSRFLTVLFFCSLLTLRAQVIFVHGWQVIPSDLKMTEQKLQKIFPGRKIILWQWSAGDRKFEKSRKQAEKEASRLAQYIAGLPEHQRRTVIIVGHSLGGLTAVKAMQFLAEKQLVIERGIFLGAAVPDNDPAIAGSFKAALKCNINVYHPQDYILRDIYGAFSFYKQRHSFALGAFGYAYPCRKKDLCQIRAGEYLDNSDYLISLSRNHLLSRYLSVLEEHFAAAGTFCENGIDYSTAADMVKVPLMIPANKVPIPALMFKLIKPQTLRAYRQWMLVWFYHKAEKVRTRLGDINIPEISVYCIIDPRGRVMGWATGREYAESVFANIEEQLKNLQKDPPGSAGF